MKRRGRGRPAKRDKKRMYSTKLRPDQIAWLQSRHNAAAEIEIAIDARRRKVLQDMGRKYRT